MKFGELQVVFRRPAGFFGEPFRRRKPGTRPAHAHGKSGTEPAQQHDLSSGFLCAEPRPGRRCGHDPQIPPPDEAVLLENLVEPVGERVNSRAFRLAPDGEAGEKRLPEDAVHVVQRHASRLRLFVLVHVEERGERPADGEAVGEPHRLLRGRPAHGRRPS